MARRKKRSLLLFAGGFLLALAVVIGGSKLWDNYRRTHSKLSAEIIYCYPNSKEVLAAEVGNENGSLFIFSWPEEAEKADPAFKQPGTLVELTGPEDLLPTYPMQYGPVLSVKKTGQRHDFVEDYYFDLRQKLQGKDEKAVENTVYALDSLNDEEKEGLHYLLKSYLKL